VDVDFGFAVDFIDGVLEAVEAFVEAEAVVLDFGAVDAVLALAEW
jgi:hypothetical protein